MSIKPQDLAVEIVLTPGQARQIEGGREHGGPVHIIDPGGPIRSVGPIRPIGPVRAEPGRETPQ